MRRLHKAAKTALVVQAFNWTALGLSFVSVPLYLHWLGQERYGLLLIGLAFAGYLMFLDAGLSWSTMMPVGRCVRWLARSGAQRTYILPP
jgi:O-antigen/teichoic acid export membrane protein